MRRNNGVNAIAPSANGLDDLAEIIGHLMTKSVVGNQQEPRIRRPSV
jgi:hypothetical protein